MTKPVPVHPTIADEPGLKWIVPLTAGRIARNCLCCAGLGAAIGCFIVLMVSFCAHTPLVMLIPIAAVCELVVMCKLLRRWHGQNRSAQAIVASTVEIGAMAAAMIFTLWIGGIPVAWSLGIAGVLSVAGFLTNFSRFWKQDTHLRYRAVCRECGYSLIGVEGLQCPECGYVFLPEHELGLARHDLKVRAENDLPQSPRC